MCVIIQATYPVTNHDLWAAATSNPDGFGIMWAENGRVEVVRTMDAKEAIDLCHWLGSDYVLHCRWATSGVKDVENCHPFPLADGAHLAHNGTFPLNAMPACRSDTWEFCRELREAGIGGHFTKRWFRKRVSRIIGSNNRLAVMQPGGHVSTVGNWSRHDGNLWSNTNCLLSTPQYESFEEWLHR